MCSGCDGTGTLASEAWERWYAESTRLVALVSDADREPVLRTLVNQLLQRHEQERPTEARERRCDDCGGAGTVPTEEGHELLAFLRRHRER
ncbi:hypothetical protein [Cellulomonas sp. ATA003]|uniref:hypothetical protein n=1 Tax=Cellulomonas sp. ATA003 TaxID=3073064 RepID=UPI0028734835|nr:hypothetical protein [Cellulomonas sp. ATA003]WNB86996.1 hypothetical protein REH70_07590 [Cellulomonas sp. ATA003]